MARATNIRKVVYIVVPAILFALICLMLVGKIWLGNADPQSAATLPGKPLAAFTDLYPVEAESNGSLVLNTEKFMNAVDYFAANPSPRAIVDLIYIGQANNIALVLSSNEKERYSKLTDDKSYRGYLNNQLQRNEVLQTYAQLVNGIGETFRGTPIEIVLHDTRDPLHSIIAVQNPISGRKIGDPNSNFGVELIKSYSMIDTMGSNFVSYPLKLKDGRAVKSTTVPIYDKKYGLVALICMNIDISKLSTKDAKAIDSMITNLVQTYPQERISEIIENSRSTLKK